jgi:hypothetical protein
VKRILRSIYGQQLGTVDDYRVLARAGLLVGDWGKQMPIADLNQVVTFDDFNDATILGTWGVNKGTDGAAANFACPAAGGASGIIVGTTGATTNSMAGSGIEITDSLSFQAQTAAGSGQTNPSNNLEFDVRVQLSAITNVVLFVGFTNALSTTLQMPIQGAGGGNGFTKNANDAVGFLFDTAMTTADWWTIGVKGGTLTAGQDSGSGPTAATYDQFHISVDQTGQATFFRNGQQVGVSIPNSVTPNVLLTPVIAAYSHAAASRNVTADYIMASMNRV